MARFLKSVYFKSSAHVKFRSFATKTNPYIEVLKTLRSWEHDLRSKSKVLFQRNESAEVSSKDISPAQSTSENENENLNPQNKSLHLNNDVDTKITRTNDITFNSKNHEQFKENLDSKQLSEHSFYVEETKFSDKQMSDKYFNELRSHGHSEVIGPIRDTNERTTSTCQIKTDSVSPKFKKKKIKPSKSRTTDLLQEESNTSSEKTPDRLFSGHSAELNENTELINYTKNVQKNTSGKNIDLKFEKPKKKSKKGKTGKKNESKMFSPAHSVAKSPVKDSKSILECLNAKSDSKIGKIPSSLIESHNVSSFGKEFSVVKSKKVSKHKSKAKFSALKEDQKLKAKQESAIQSIRSLVEAYINANEINKAYRTFELLMHTSRKEFIDVNIFNVMISGWAREGRLDKVKHLFLLMSSEKITPNLQSYVHYFEAIARNKCLEVAEISKIVGEMKSHGFSPKELLEKGIFVGDQREKVIQVLGFVERDLNLPLYVPGDAYSCKLLLKLNDKNHGKGEHNFEMCYQPEDILGLSSAQLEIEERSTIKIKSVDTVTELTDKVLKSREYIKELENMWRKQLTKVINGLKTPKKQQQGILGLSPNQSIYPYLAVIDTQVLVDLLLQETRMLGETAEFYSPNIKFLYKDLGIKVMRHYVMELNRRNNVTEKVHFIYQKYLDHLLDPDLTGKYLPREYWEFLKSKYADGPTIDVPNSDWAYSLLIFIGSILYDVLRSSICFNPNRIKRKSDSNFMYPAFHIVYEHHDVKLNRQIRAHDMFTKLYRDAKLDYLEFDVSLVPMLAPPRPWIKYDSGGLIITKVPFIRFPEQAQSLSSFYYKVPTHQMNPCFDSLNNLSLCPWIINKPILDIVIKIFQEGGSEELDVPLNPANFHFDPECPETSEEDGKSSFKLKMEYEKKKGEMTSLWFDCLYKLSIANHFRDKVFWFPHNLDFRGRVYPTPPHFNHLGSDLSRSILLFAAGKPLGEKGLDWLKIHLVNLTGFKKRAPHSERLEYANEIIPKILDTADNPFGDNWWIESDKPLQTLACCKEVASAVRHPNPPEYVSHFPVHQDGSCNGLQHYAALGRDELGAIEVNLHPSDSPQDVYSGVSALVEKEREKDASMGLEIAQVLEGFVTRKVVKQTVMTFVYGVTPYGARLQVLKQLKDMPEFPEKYQHAAATYLMKNIFLSIKEMFTATKKIQDWFTSCAEEITRVTGDAVEWVTPLGLPVIQPYYKETVIRGSKFCISKSNKDNINHYVSHFEPYQLPNVRKQKNAFAPNFIHSLDSTHMMLTSLFCHRMGVTFVSVHDCYWTHSCTVKEMNKICREQFVSLHSEPILEDLSAFFVERFAKSSEKSSDMSTKQLRASARMRDVLSAVPDKGTFNLRNVLNSEYFFS